MTKYLIERKGEYVKQVVLLGEGLYRQKDIQLVIVDEKNAKELLQIWPDAKMVTYEEALLVKAA